MKRLLHLATRVFDTPLLIQREKLETILSVLGSRIGVRVGMDGVPLPVLGPFNDPDDDDDDEGDITGLDELADSGIRVIKIHGSLVKHSSGMNVQSGMCSYDRLRDVFADVFSDSATKGVVLDIDSPGGEVGGLFDLCDFILSSKPADCPMYAVANDDCYSAAYALAACADEIWCTQSGGVGSIGCFMLHVDRSKMDDEMGVKYTYIKAGDKKTDGNPHEPLSPSARKTFQDKVDNVREMFVNHVAKSRGVSADALLKTEAGIFFGADAMPLLVDKIGSLDECCNQMKAAIDAASGDENDDATAADDDENDGAVPAGADVILPGAEAAAIGSHSTATSTKPWDGPANKARLKNDKPASYYRRAYAWVDPKGDGTKKASYKFIHHEVSSSGVVGAANVVACRSGIGVLNGGRGGTVIPAGDKKGVYNHLAKHLRDAGVEPPAYKGEDGLPSAVAEHEILLPLLASMEADRLRLEPFFPGVISSVVHVGTAKVKKDGDSGTPNQRPCVDLLAVPYNSLSGDLGGFRETYQPGCFSSGLGSDLRVLFNHNSEYVLGRKSASTARFWETEDGVHASADYPATSWVADLLVSMNRGDINQSSAAFYILAYRWEQRNGQKVRVIEKALMREVSIVSFAAYEEATASVRQPPPVPPSEARSEISEVEVGVDIGLLGDHLRLLRLR